MEELLRQILLHRSATTLNQAAQQDGMFHAQRADRIQAQTASKMFQAAASASAGLGAVQGRTQGSGSRPASPMFIPQDQVLNEHGQPAYMNDTDQAVATSAAARKSAEDARWAGVPAGQLPALKPGQDTATDSELIQYGPDGIPGMKRPYVGGADSWSGGNDQRLRYGHGPADRVEFKVKGGPAQALGASGSAEANTQVLYPDDEKMFRSI